MVSFDSDHSGGDGASLSFFQVSSDSYVPLPVGFGLLCDGVWEELFLATLLICGVAAWFVGSLGLVEISGLKSEGCLGVGL